MLFRSATETAVRGTEAVATDASATAACCTPAGSKDAPAIDAAKRGVLLSEFRYGTWSRSFRFPAGIDRDQLQATYRDGLLRVRVPKAQRVSTVSVTVEG